MMASTFFDNRLRPAIEFVPGLFLCGSGVLMYFYSAMFFPFIPPVAQAVGIGFTIMGIYRLTQGARLLRYRGILKQLPRYSLDAPRIPLSRYKLFLGKGFRWDQRHSQRLVEARAPGANRWLQHGIGYRLARQAEITLEHSPLLGWLPKLTQIDHRLNPLRPLPPLGGDTKLHGVGAEDEADIWMDLGDRVGHTLVLGTTRVGKTRFEEVLSTQDIRRGETVIVFDPKGDTDLLLRMWAAAKRAGRLNEFHIFHLGYPDLSERYNPVGDFGRITEVASRIARQLPAQGNSSAFREFAWRFTNIVSQALVALGRKPDYKAIARYVTNIEPLMVEYFHSWLDQCDDKHWRESVSTIERNIEDKNLPFALKGRDHHAIALTRYTKERGLYDPISDGLRSAFEYDKTYFDKLTASLLPLLEKLTSGRSGELLAPDYNDLNDTRPVLDWMRVIREKGIVYVGLDALSDPEVASAVGNSMFSDLTSIAGKLYKHGDTLGLPAMDGHTMTRIALHADEFNELCGDEFIPMLNKAGGAGIQVTAYTQTSSDIEAGIGDRAKAGQIAGNLNTLIMLRVQNEETAKFLTDRLPMVRVFTKIAESRATDNNDPGTSIDFVAQNADRLVETEIEMLRPADLVQLPKGQAFALLEGGQLYKIRLPLAGADDLMPASLADIIEWSEQVRGRSNA